MSATVHIRFSEAEIQRQAKGSAKTLRDDRYPALRFRFHGDRARGSWHVVVGGHWRKAGSYPDLTASAMLDALPQVVARRTAEPEASSNAQGFTTVGQVLEWQLDRQLRNRSLSAKRKASVKSMILRHLLPRLREAAVLEVTKPLLDRLLFWPLQEEFSAGYVRQAYGILMGAMRQAHRLDLITTNPMGSMRFTDFVRGKIPPKPAGLRPDATRPLLATLADHYGKAPGEALVALLMLCHGTRLGETRSARWRDFWLEEGLWTIPAADTKTRAEHQLPLTPQVLALLRAHRERQQQRGVDSVYLFPGARGKPLSPSQATAIFKGISGGEWSSHDLRKLARTSWTELGVDHLIGEMLLNHVLRGVAAAYIQTQARERKALALQLWHDHLDTLGFKAIHGGTEAERAPTDNPIHASSAAAASAF